MHSRMYIFLMLIADYQFCETYKWNKNVHYNEEALLKLIKGRFILTMKFLGWEMMLLTVRIVIKQKNDPISSLKDFYLGSS
jgi:hypothetical protein